MIEFFSGIGGMRLAIERALSLNNSSDVSDQHRRPSRIASCHAYEISLAANTTYQHNFHKDEIHLKSSTSEFSVNTKLVEQLCPTDRKRRNPELLKFRRANLWTMSPPCQPFTTTRGGKLLDMDDKRCDGFKAIIKLLRYACQAQKDSPDDATSLRPPRWILLENVKGFADSRMLAEWKRCLVDCGYIWNEYLLSPVQFGIPNHRLRYYMTCRRRTTPINNTPTTTIRTSLLHDAFPPDTCRKTLLEYLDRNLLSTDSPSLARQESLAPYLVPDSVLRQPWASDLSVVTPQATETYCFTAGYGRVYHKATGSLFLLHDTAAEQSSESSVFNRSKPIMDYSGRIRRFTSKELLNLFGFRKDFHFPPSVDLEKQYKLVGNAVNVEVVAHVAIDLLFCEKDEDQDNQGPGTC